jgi:hypothetical protein
LAAGIPHLRNSFFFLALVSLIFMSLSATAKDPLQVHPKNPRYFTDGSGKAVFLTGSHTWGSLLRHSWIP